MNLHMCAKCGANRSSRLTASTYFWICDPLNPQTAPCDIEGRIVFSLCPFPDESADVCQIWCQSVQLFDRFPRLLNLWPPRTPWGIDGELYLAYAHSQTNPQICTKFGANRSSRLTASPNNWICAPLKKPKCPWGIVERIVFSLCPFPDESADVYQIRCQPVQPFDSFPRLCDPLPPNAPWGIEGRLLFSICPFPDEYADVSQSWCQSDSFPIFFNCWIPKTPQVPPLCLEGQFVWRISIPIWIWICTCVANLVPICPAVW